MAKSQLMQTNFTAGELSPKLMGRVDIAKYQNGCKRMREMVPVQYGGAKRREGTKFIAEVADSTKATRLIPFIHSKDDAYILEFGHLVMRVYKNGALVMDGGSPYEITTSIASTKLAEIDYTQGEDTLIIFHKSFYPVLVRRYGDTNWRIVDMPYGSEIPQSDGAPRMEIGFREISDITIAATTGSGVIVSGYSNWMPADVGRELTCLGGAGTIATYTSATEVEIDITSDFVSVDLDGLTYEITDTPVATLTPSAVGPVGATITLTLSVSGWSTVSTLTDVYVNGGRCRILSIGGAGDTVATCKVMQVLASTTAAAYGSWSMRYDAFSATDSNPTTGTIHEQRLYMGGSSQHPQTIFASKSGQYFDFTTGTNDDDGIQFTIASDQANPVQYLASSRTLLALTYGGEFTIEGGVEKPITPTNVQIKLRSNKGCAQIRPVRVDFEEMYVHRSGKRVMAFGYDYSSGDWISSDISLLSEHLLSTGVEELVYQQEPEPRIYARLSDGKLAVCSFSREQDISGWSLWDVGGIVNSIAVIPTTDSERVYAVVERAIDGNTLQYVEIFEPGFFLDSGITGTAAPAETVWAGLDHLEGEEVSVIADGSYSGEYTVTGGEVTLPEAAGAVSIGYLYAPTLTPLPPDVGGGLAHGNSVRLAEVVLRFLETTNCQIDGKEVSFRRFGDVLLDQPLPSFTGLKRLEKLGWSDNEESEMVITSQWPFEFHLLALIRKITLND